MGLNGKNILIRIAEYGDISEIKKITYEAFLGYRSISGADKLEALSESEDDIKNDIDTKLVLIAECDGDILGSVRIELLPDSTAYLTRFGVKADVQNIGIGKSIMNFVDELMLEKNIKSLFLHTSSKATPMVRFYYGRGFYVKDIDNSRGYPRALMEKIFSN